jgi:HEPN domain-containing protein
MEKLGTRAIDSAEHWYSVAEDSIKLENYDTAVYGMEMSLEIGLKGILMKNKIDYPKIHDVTAVLRSRAGRLKLSRQFSDRMDDMLETFQILLKYRNDAGYLFSGASDPAVLKEVAVENIEKVREYLDLLRKEIL